MTEIKNESCVGQIQIADEVIAIIAGTAAIEVDGVAFMAGHFTRDIAEILGRKNLSKGVAVMVNESEVIISLNLLVKLGHKVREVTYEVQEKVKTAVETMTGLTVKEVNINVTGVHSGKERPSKQNEFKD